MNMPTSNPVFRFYPAVLLAFLLLLAGCGEDSLYRYEVNPVDVQSPTAGKDKQKSLEQYISSLYANLFQKALSANELVEIRKVMESIGDKEIAKEIIIQNLLNRPGVMLPANEEMRADLDQFLDDTYQRFFVRNPTEAEKAWMTSFISSNPDMTPELVFFSFAMSEEYQFY